MNTLKGKIVSSILSIAAIVTLIGFGVSSFAWFSSNKNTNADGLKISSTSTSNLFFTYQLYYYDNEKSQVVHKDEQKAKLDLSLQDYNTSISESTSSFNTILRVTVDFYGQDSSKTFKFSTKVSSKETVAGDPYIGGEGEATRTYADTTGFKYNYSIQNSSGAPATFLCDNISNIIQFKYFVYSYSDGKNTYLPSSTRPYLVQTDLRIDNSSDTTVYNSATAIFAELSSSDSFVSGDSKTNELSKAFSNIPGTAKSIDFFIEYNYSETLLNKYLKNNEYLKNRDFDDITSLDLNVEYKKDIESIVFDLETV